MQLFEHFFAQYFLSTHKKKEGEPQSSPSHTYFSKNYCFAAKDNCC